MSAAKYFIAIVLPEPEQTQIEEIKLELFSKHNLRGALRSPAHITLHRPFEWKEEKESQLIERIQQFSGVQAFDIEMHNFGFFEPRVIYAQVKANTNLQHMHAQLVKFAKKELLLFNEAEDLRGFHPHVTVAFRDLKKPLFYQLREKYRNEKLQATFRCKSFSLLKLRVKWEILHTFDI